MNILKTFDDGSVRSAAILHTQNELRFPLGSRQLGPEARDAVELTLVQTSSGVRTLRALVDDLLRRQDAEQQLQRLVEEARNVGMPTVAEGLYRTWGHRQAESPRIAA